MELFGFGLGPDITIIGSLNLNMILKIEFMKLNGLLTYQIHFRSSLNSPNEKSCDCFTFPPLLLLVDNSMCRVDQLQAKDTLKVLTLKGCKSTGSIAMEKINIKLIESVRVDMV
jgi:hypothetical protein